MFGQRFTEHLPCARHRVRPWGHTGEQGMCLQEHSHKRAVHKALRKSRSDIANPDWRSCRKNLKELAFEIKLERLIKTEESASQTEGMVWQPPRAMKGCDGFEEWVTVLCGVWSMQVKTGKNLGWTTKLGPVWDKSSNLYKEFKPYLGTRRINREFEAGDCYNLFFFFLMTSRGQCYSYSKDRRDSRSREKIV